MGSSNTGTIIIVVIVLLALVAIIAGALIFYSKKNDLWCFAPEESTNTKVKTIWFYFQVSETRQGTRQHYIKFVLLHTFQPIAMQRDSQH